MPVEVRRHLRLESGDRLKFIIADDGTVRVAPEEYPDVASVRGAAGSLGRDVSIEEMLEIARDERLIGKALPP